MQTPTLSFCCDPSDSQDELPLVSSLNFSKQSMRPSEFSFVPLGERTIKGKGLLSTYLVTEGDWETALAGYRAQQQQAWQPTPEGIKAHQIGYEEGMRAGIASTAVIARQACMWYLSDMHTLLIVGWILLQMHALSFSQPFHSTLPLNSSLHSNCPCAGAIPRNQATAQPILWARQPLKFRPLQWQMSSAR